MSFVNLGLSEALLKAVAEQQYTEATPIQAQAIPAILAGGDLMASAQTGTGKTAGFTLPLLQKLEGGERTSNGHIRALILTPTRELAAQVHDSIKTYGKFMKIRSAVVFGGVKINPQMMILRGGLDILVATPGRLLDLHQQNAVKFDKVEILILDEADRMLDMGFIKDIKKVLAMLPKKRQNLLFSATFSGEIQELARGLLQNPAQISVAPMNTTAERVTQTLHPVDKSRKTELLSHLISSNNWYQVLVFSRTKHGANKLVMMLEKDGIQAAAIHGNKSQAQRTKVLHQFKNGELQVLVATDIAARGIDIDQLPHVINFDLPDVPEDYVHRIGRTARAGSEGQAISLVSADQTKQLKQIEKVLKTRLLLEVVPGFEQRERAQDEKEGIEAPRRAMAERQARSQSRSDNGRSASPRTSGTSARTSNGPARSSGAPARTSTPRSTELGQQRAPQRGNFDADKPFSRGPRRDPAATARPSQPRHVGIRPTPDSVDQERLYQSRGNQAAPAADARTERSDRRTPQRKANPQRKDGTRVVSVW
ncbi:DEAD/DEAH box helicase [Gammaproteobacteria bacterium LSUCC0112]|nr:DEAD/DEAH box helicase [Gammaproteobacteria bacterium LSUCC0112]